MSTTDHDRARARTTGVRSGRRAGPAAVIGLTASLLLAACGAAATPAPTATPTAAATPTPTPTAAATPAPSLPERGTQTPPADASTVPGSPDAAANGGFAFAATDVLAYYKGLGYECQAPTASTQAAGYTVQRCLLSDAASGTILLIAVVTDPSGVTGDAFAGVLDAQGKTMPSSGVAAKPLLSFLGALLGEAVGIQAGAWAAQHLGETTARTVVAGMVVGTYTENDAKGVGVYIEVANKAFMDAPAP